MEILLVEDEPRLLRALAKALREEGYAVDTAAAGDEALYKAESSDYDVILLDLMLPQLDGAGTCSERLRKQTSPRLCCCSPRGMATRDRVRGLDAGGG